MIENKLLLRQLKRVLGLSDPSCLGSDLLARLLPTDHSSSTTAITEFIEQFEKFLERIQESNEQYERDLTLRTRSLEISSQELTDAYNKSRQDAQAQQRVIHALRTTANTLLVAENKAQISEENEGLERLSSLMLELISEREIANMQLKHSEERLELALNGTEQGLWDWNIANNHVFFSPQWYSLLGYDDQELSMSLETFTSLIHPEDIPLMEQTLDAHLQNKSALYSLEVRMKSKGGKWVWIRSAGKVVSRTTNGQALRMVGTHTNIQEQKEMQATLLIAKQNAEAASQAKSDFLANMSHEIRTPMNGIIGLTDLVLETSLEKEQHEYLVLVHHSAQNLLSIINDILDFSKIEAGKLSIERLAINTQEIVQEIYSLMRFNVEAKGLKFILEVHPDVPNTLYLDPIRFRQICFNLINNALKFTEKGHIRWYLMVEKIAQSNEFYLHSSIEDTGIGIPEDKLSSIFMAFNQADNSTTRRFGGTGLGLTISQHLCHLMGGEIRVESTVNIGSTFRFNLLNIPTQIENLNSPPLTDTAITTVSNKTPRHILLVEDNVVNQKLMLSLLHRQHHQTTLANNGQEAVALFTNMQKEHHQFDLILMDMQMPIMNGYEATHMIRSLEAQHPELPATPIIALTANAMQGDAEKCLSAGMNDYLSKPIQVDKLKEKIVTWAYSTHTHPT